jgi:hypothetical protein
MPIYQQKKKKNTWVASIEMSKKELGWRTKLTEWYNHKEYCTKYPLLFFYISLGLSFFWFLNKEY